MDDGDVNMESFEEPVCRSEGDPVGGIPSDVLKRLTALAADYKIKVEDLSRELSTAQADLTTVQTEITRTLEALGIDSVKMNGFNFYVQENESVKTPKTLEEKQAFFEYLRGLGLFDEMVSVNSMTLNSFYKTMSEEALSKGILEFRMPGIAAPTSYKQLKMRKV